MISANPDVSAANIALLNIAQAVRTRAIVLLLIIWFRFDRAWSLMFIPHCSLSADLQVIVP